MARWSWCFLNFKVKVHQQTETQAEQLNLQTSFLYTHCSAMFASGPCLQSLLWITNTPCKLCWFCAGHTTSTIWGTYPWNLYHQVFKTACQLWSLSKLKNSTQYRPLAKSPDFTPTLTQSSSIECGYWRCNSMDATLYCNVTNYYCSTNGIKAKLVIHFWKLLSIINAIQVEE